VQSQRSTKYMRTDQRQISNILQIVDV
ncbi:unnamed protein product, partial [Rotaria sordida]